MASNQNKNQSRSLLAFRWLSILILVFRGVLTLCFLFPLLSSEKKNREIKKWSNALLKKLNVRLEVDGIKNIPVTPFLLVSNHISWLDIQLLNAYKPISFVAKSEVARWPIFGWMAKQLGTVFIKRDNYRHGKHVANEVAKVLETQSVCIFPEGTSTIGEVVLPFKPNLFESAVIAGVPVYSLAISYWSSASGERSDVAAFVGEMGLLESMAKILNDRQLIVELTFLPPSGGHPEASRDRKWLALHSQEAISNYLNGHQPLM